MQKRPRIGITMRIEHTTDRFYLARHYSEAIEAAGGAPLHISLIPNSDYIDSIVEVKVGEPISFEINRSGEEPLQFSGTIAYRLNGMGFGVQYSQLDAAQDRFLRGLS